MNQFVRHDAYRGLERHSFSHFTFVQYLESRIDARCRDRSLPNCTSEIRRSPLGNVGITGRKLSALKDTRINPGISDQGFGIFEAMDIADFA